MNCKSCGAPLTLENEKCPYCGTAHRYVHQTEVVNHREKLIRIIIICIMVTLLILSVLFVGVSWDIAYGVEKWKAAANSEKLSDMLDEYEENGDFLAFAALYDEKALYGVDAFEEYRYVYTAASNYKSIFGYISTLLEEEHWEDGHENALEYLMEALDYHYEYIEGEPYEFYYELGAYDEQHLKAVEQITAKIEALIQLTFDMTNDELEGFRKSSAAEKQVFIERRFAEYE